VVCAARSATKRVASSAETYFRKRDRESADVISRKSSGEVISSARPSSAASSVSTDGACGERKSAAETSTFASATARSINQRRALRERRLLGSCRKDGVNLDRLQSIADALGVQMRETITYSSAA
jgi:hypothetical protein